MSQNYQAFLKFGKSFTRNELYSFEAIATTDTVDSHGTKFDLNSIQHAVPYLPIHIEHGVQPIGSTVDYYYETNDYNGNRDSMSMIGVINTRLWPMVVEDIKEKKYSGVSIGGVFEKSDVKNGVIYNALINEISLTARPSNPDAIIYKRNSMLDPSDFIQLTASQKEEYFRSMGFNNNMVWFIQECVQRAMQ